MRYTAGVRILRPSLWLLAGVTPAVSACHALGSLPPVDTGAGPSSGPVEVTPAALDFGDVEAGSVSCMAFTLHNQSSDAVTVAGQYDPVGDAGFSVGALAVDTLGAGESVDVPVCFAPQDDAVARAQIAVISADTVIAVSGVGHAPRALLGEPLVEPVLLGCAGRGSVAVTNLGSRDLVLTDVSATSPQVQVDGWPTLLEPGARGEITFTFTPDVGGTLDAALAVATNEPGGGQSVGVSLLGYEGAQVEESFVFTPTDPTDVVFVVDGARVGPYAGSISAAAAAYVDALRAQNVDFQLTAVSSASACPTAPAFATRSDTALRASTVLSRAFAGAGGAWDDDLLGLASATLDQAVPDACLAGFRRPGADLDVVVVALGPSTADVDARLDELRAQADASVRVSALVPTTGSCGTRADDYLLAAAATDGATEDVCRADWTSAFEAFATLPAGSDDVRYPLAEVPVPSTIRVEVSGVARSDWTYAADDNSLLFAAGAVALGADVQIHYVSAVTCEPGSS